MKILRRYILRELSGPFIYSFVIFTFAMLTGNIIKLADLIINKGVDLFSVAKLFFFMLPWLFTFTVPMAVLTATLIGFGRLSSDNEIIAMRASGISLYRIVFPLVIVGLIISLLSYEMNDWLLPRLRHESRKLIAQIGVKNPTAYLEPGTFIKEFKNYIIFVYGIDKNKLTNIRIYEPQPGRPTRTIIAARGEIQYLPLKDAVRLILYNGTMDQPNPKDPENFYKLNFKKYYMDLDLKQGRETNIQKKKSDMSIAELNEEIKKLAAEGINAVPLAIEIHKKISYSFSSLIFILIGAPLGLMARRGGFVGYALSVAVIIVYYLLLLGGQALAIKGAIFPGLGIWMPNLVFGAVGPSLIFWMAEQ